jgi:hypothetical protein
MEVGWSITSSGGPVHFESGRLFYCADGFWKGDVEMEAMWG